LFESENLSTALPLFKAVMGYPYAGKMDNLSLGRRVKEIKSPQFFRKITERRSWILVPLPGSIKAVTQTGSHLRMLASWRYKPG
jgi:hypothetical protein